jgi:hypothetical protein
MAETAPTPWHVKTLKAGGHSRTDTHYIGHADGFGVAEVYDLEDAELIVEAVNHYVALKLKEAK